jgi:hypothetical protein
VRRYSIDHLCALNFVMEQALEGGVNESLNLDSHGKSWSFLLLALPIELRGSYQRNPRRPSTGRSRMPVPSAIARVSIRCATISGTLYARPTYLGMRVLAVGGWSTGGTEELHSGGLRPTTLAREIAKVRYEGLDLSRL